MFTVDKAKPFVKWPGGKRQLVDEILKYFPQEITRYHEICVGGGALMYAVAKRCKEIIISDVNEELICTYEVIKETPEKLIALLSTYKNEEQFYYDIRDKESEDPIEIAARFIFLNKTAFNGLYRVNSKGKFNAPFGFYEKPNYCDQETIMAVHQFLNLYNVRIILQGYDQSIAQMGKGSFVYIDPPYVPVKKTSFVQYIARPWKMSDHEKLAKFVNALDDEGISSVESNAFHEVIPQLYRNSKLIEVQANRAVNSDGSGRGKIPEYLILTGKVFRENNQ